MQLKEHESALRIKLLETEHAIKDEVSKKEQLQADYNKLYNLLDCDEGELKSARQRYTLSNAHKLPSIAIREI